MVYLINLKRLSRNIFFGTLAIVVTHTAFGAKVPTPPSVNYGEGDTAKLIKRGEYLAKIGDCIGCHTNTEEGGKPFAGGLPLTTARGTFYSPNITPSKETGIGGWTNDEFVNAMTQGKNPHGSNYYPIFPYPYFNKLNRHDILSIKAYLDALPVVKQENKKHNITIPFNLRFLLYGWKSLFFYPHDGEFKYNDDKTPAWNRGAYLVEGLGHCDMCHTPHNTLGAPKRDAHLMGGQVGDSFAPDITHYGLSDLPAADVVDLFSEGHTAISSEKLIGNLAGVDHESLKNLTKKDLKSIAYYLKTITFIDPREVVGLSGFTHLAKGKETYEKVCKACHEAGVSGAPKIGDTESWGIRAQKGEGVLIQHALNGLNAMPAKGGCVTCTDDEIKAGVSYLMAHSLTQPQLDEAKLKPAPKPTLADGKRVYDNVCSVCHAKGDLGAQKLGDKEVWKTLIKKNIDVLVTNTLKGKGNMPAKGACTKCTRSEVIAAVKYMVQEGADKGQYKLW